MKAKLLLLAMVVVPLPAAAQVPQHEMPPTVSVNATGRVAREPDQAMLMLAVESTAASAQEAARENATKMDRLIEALRRAGITGRDVRTISYEIHPEYDHQRERTTAPRIVGYRAVNMVQVTIDTVSKVGAVIDAAVQAGSNRIAGLNFQLRNAEAAHHDAVREATRRARAEAAIVAEALGMRLGQVVNVSTSGYHPPPPMPMMMRQSADYAGAPAPPTPVEPGSVEIMASVSALFRLEPR